MTKRPGSKTPKISSHKTVKPNGKADAKLMATWISQLQKDLESKADKTEMAKMMNELYIKFETKADKLLVIELITKLEKKLDGKADGKLFDESMLRKLVDGSSDGEHIDGHDGKTEKSLMKKISWMLHGLLTRTDGKADGHLDGHLDGQADGKADGKATGKDKLTKREAEVLQFVADGLTSTKIADKLHISFDTVETHRKNINKKIGVSTAAEATAYGFRNRMLK